jgi:hypothetical protein
MDLETWLDEEFKLLGVEVKVRHLLPDKYVKGSANAGISVVTVAYVDDIDVVKITTLLTGIEIACYRDSPNGGKASEMRDSLAYIGYPGVAVCETPKSKRIRRIMSKGRLLKALRAERFG